MTVLIAVELHELPLLPDSIRQRLGFPALVAAIQGAPFAMPTETAQEQAAAAAAASGKGGRKGSKKKGADGPAVPNGTGSDGLPPANPKTGMFDPTKNAQQFAATQMPGDPTQMSYGMDITTGQPTQIGAAPMPGGFPQQMQGFSQGFPQQMQGFQQPSFPGQQMAAVSNAPTYPAQPPAMTNPPMTAGNVQVTASHARQAALAMFQRDGNNASRLNQVLQSVNIAEMGQISDANAAVAYMAISRAMGG